MYTCTSVCGIYMYIHVYTYIVCEETKEINYVYKVYVRWTTDERFSVLSHVSHTQSQLWDHSLAGPQTRRSHEEISTGMCGEW